MTRKGPLTWVDLPGPYYNTNAQIRDLERLVKQLPQRTSPESATAALRRRPRTAKQLNTEQSAQLVASYPTRPMYQPPSGTPVKVFAFVS
jgi:hypothetical protein